MNEQDGATDAALQSSPLCAHWPIATGAFRGTTLMSSSNSPCPRMPVNPHSS